MRKSVTDDERKEGKKSPKNNTFSFQTFYLTKALFLFQEDFEKDYDIVQKIGEVSIPLCICLCVFVSNAVKMYNCSHLSVCKSTHTLYVCTLVKYAFSL
jgi:hypothetical protein